MGSNPASNHPVSFKWITKAMEKGRKLICVDPRFTQSAAKAHIYAPLRSGTDIAFLGGMIKYILDNNLIQKSMSTITPTPPSWSIRPSNCPGTTTASSPGLKDEQVRQSHLVLSDGCRRRDQERHDPAGSQLRLPAPEEALFPLHPGDGLQDHRDARRTSCWRFTRSTPPPASPTRPATILYAMGWTQHTVGVQNIRAMSIIQLLLGNMGIAGGGVEGPARRVQRPGFDRPRPAVPHLPGYLGRPAASHATLKALQ